PRIGRAPSPACERVVGGLGAAWLPPHAPLRRRTPTEPEFLGHREAVPFIEVPVARPRCLEEGGHPLAVAALEHRRQQRPAKPAALPVGVHADESEVVVWL